MKQHGRWLRVTKQGSDTRLINLDHVSHVTSNKGYARFHFINHDFIDTTSDFEEVGLAIMVVEHRAADEPVPPLTREEVDMLQKQPIPFARP